MMRAALGIVGTALGGTARRLFSVKAGALASLVLLACAMVIIASDPETTGLSPRLIGVVMVYSVSAGIMATSVAHFMYPGFGPARRALRNVRVGNAARASWRVLLLGALEIAAVVAWRSRSGAWAIDVVETLLMAAGPMAGAGCGLARAGHHCDEGVLARPTHDAKRNRTGRAPGAASCSGYGTRLGTVDSYWPRSHSRKWAWCQQRDAHRRDSS